MLGIAGVVAASAVVLYPYVGKELVPDDDQSEFSVNLRLPRGTSYERTLEYMSPIEGELRQTLGSNLQAMMTSIQNGSGNYSVQLKPIEERELSQQQLMQTARRTLGKYRNARISVSGGTDISGASSAGYGRGGGGGGQNRLNMMVQGPDVDELQKYATTLLEKVREIDGVTDSDTSFEATQPEVRITADRQRAAQARALDHGAGADLHHALDQRGGVEVPEVVTDKARNRSVGIASRAGARLGGCSRSHGLWRSRRR